MSPDIPWLGQHTFGKIPRVPGSHDLSPNVEIAAPIEPKSPSLFSEPPQKPVASPVKEPETKIHYATAS